MLNWATAVGGSSLAASVFSAVPVMPGGRFRGVLRAAPPGAPVGRIGVAYFLFNC
jgi:hypothetical protein